MNSIHIGLDEKQFLFEEPFLLIDDHPDLKAFPTAKVFDPRRHRFDPLEGMNYRKARDLTATIYSAFPEGENTLTVRNGKRRLTRLLTEIERLDQLPKPEKDDLPLQEAIATIDDILFSPVLKRVFCSKPNFTFEGSIVARINRAELGDFDSFILAQCLIGQFKGQVIVPDFGFYGRDFHTSLMREDRLTVGLTYLDEVSPYLQKALLAIKDKHFQYRLLQPDAERLIAYTDNPAGNIKNLM